MKITFEEGDLVELEDTMELELGAMWVELRRKVGPTSWEVYSSEANKTEVVEERFFRVRQG